MEPVIVWWAGLSDVRPEHLALLDGVERARHERYLRDADRVRFTLGVAITRLAVGRDLGLPPHRVPLTRACADCGGPHGPPVIAGGPYVSVSHSGDRVGVAISPHGPVGVDVEAADRPLDGVRDHLLGPGEHGSGTPELLAYWTRKEALLKVTGDGLRVPMTDLRVSAPAEPPRLLDWAGRPALAGRVTMHALDPGPGHAGCLALLDQPAAEVHERPAAEVLH